MGDWLIKSKFRGSSLKFVDFSSTTLLDSHFVDLVGNCGNLEEINISNTLVTDIECFRPIAKNIRVLKADTLRFDLNQRIKDLEDDIDYEVGRFEFYHRQTSKRDHRLI